MKTIDKIYINGEFVKPKGNQIFDLISPTTNQLIGQVALGNKQDAQDAIAAAKEAFRTFSQTTKAERIEYLKRLHEVVSRRKDELIEVMVEEYGGTLQFSRMSMEFALSSFTSAIATLEKFDFTKKMGFSEVQLVPLGVVGIIIPWNASNGFIAGKLATAVAAGCTVVIKPSEMSALQTQIMTECLHEAGLPAGVFNIVNGLGDVVGAEISSHPDVAKISFTGSSNVGKIIAREASATLKRYTLELGGKSPNILLDDADFTKAIPMAIAAAFMNNGQACVAGTRLLVPENRLEEAKELIQRLLPQFPVGNPKEETTAVGPMVSKKQYERVQNYIQLGLDEGAILLAGGLGHPEGLENGNFVKPTVFYNVDNKMRIAQEEIFGPVLSIITYKDEAEAVTIANDTIYGLQAYVSSADTERARRVAYQINAGRVLVNELNHDPEAPFGGFKQSGIGREFGVYGLEAYLEPKALIG
ncbi:aldehyde dehydrogenase family protein [Flavobacterium lindanitolerans]|uniref:aldehyde dehydrogenase family protein n=1 Tax=Flavobacterium lindanitolerans TaxID=428988 RepID=UPI0031E3CA2C